MLEVEHMELDVIQMITIYLHNLLCLNIPYLAPNFNFKNYLDDHFKTKSYKYYVVLIFRKSTEIIFCQRSIIFIES
jgi:hypothetical protein